MTPPSTIVNAARSTYNQESYDPNLCIPDSRQLLAIPTPRFQHEYITHPSIGTPANMLQLNLHLHSWFQALELEGQVMLARIDELRMNRLCKGKPCAMQHHQLSFPGMLLSARRSPILYSKVCHCQGTTHARNKSRCSTETCVSGSSRAS
jgi:hypothetical protein